MADITGTNANDILFFQGLLQTLNITFTNPYTGEVFSIDDDKNVNIASYDGLAGDDTLFMTNLGDAIFVRDLVSSEQMVFNVEVFFAGDGGDVIQLADAEFILDDIEVIGGDSDDLILSNAGDDELNGGGGDDIIDGGPGDDLLIGDNDFNVNTGNDRLNGGAGADLLLGQSGDDTLIYFADLQDNGSFAAWNIGSPGVPGTSTIVTFSGSNMSLDIFDGGTGFDTLLMTDGDDVFFLDNPYSAFHPDGTSLRLIDVELIEAGAGDDVIDLTHDVIEYGDITINGGAGDDHLWSSVGNDEINGGTGNDHIFGGFGEDTLNGDDGDDEMYGSLGDDLMRGGAGNDTLFGGASSDSEFVIITETQHVFNNTVIFPNLQETVSILDLVPPGDDALGIAAGDLSVDFETTAEVSFVSTEAGFNNSLGFYNISAADGTIMSVTLAFPNVKDFNAGDTATINLPGDPDTDFGFFIISDGARKNDFSDLDLENGTLQFIYKYNSADERLATIYDDAEHIKLVHIDGAQETVLKAKNGPHGIYHTTLRGGDTNLNHDDEVHVVSGLIEDGADTKLRIGFEDLKNTGDADYNDVVFDLTIEGKEEVVLLEDDADMLFGGAGDDVIDGGIGDDLIVGGEGADTLYGDQGADLFLFQSIAEAGDTIMDFELGTDGDIINITDVLAGFDANTDVISDFVQLAANGSDTELQVNTDGQGNDFVTLATFDGGLGAAGLTDFLSDGNLVVDQSIPV